MANHVDNYIELHGNDAAKKEFERIFNQINSSEHQSLYSAEFLPRFTDGKVGIDTIGAKWANLEDSSEDHALVVSAWSAVLPFVEELGCHLTNFDNELKITCQYIDEAYNFIGCAVYHDEDIFSDEEYYEDLVEIRSALLNQDSEEYDPWEDDEWYEFIDKRQDSILIDLLESCEEKIESNVL